MKHILQIVLVFLSLSSCGQTKNNEIESILLDCLTKSYGEKQVDINKELDVLEKYLIESKSLKSSSGQSYFDFYQEIVKLNDIPATLHYDKFDNIYKLTPNEFYSVDCLEELKRLDSTVIANSKYYQMTVAIQKAADDEVSPSSIAKAITSVLSPPDFDKPYYRAIALLTIAYTANSDIGLERQLLPTNNEDVSSYKVMTVSTTEKNQIVLNGNFVKQEVLKSTLSDFIKTNKSNHLIKFQADKGTSYDFYLKVQEAINSVYNNLRDELAKEKFNKQYKELTENELKEISEIYPSRIKE
jgi:biopolymer transport protein ExbD